MKHSLFVLFLALTGASSASAETLGSVWDYFSQAQDVCLTRVVSVEGTTVTFSVTSVLRGKPDSTLKLHPLYGGNYNPKSEWLLVSGKKGVEINAPERLLRGESSNWLAAVVIHDYSSPTYIESWCQVDVWSGPHKGIGGLPLDQVELLLKQHPYVP